ncbi:membrane protein FAM174B isoform 2-T2 [Discoglossus pictus]
MRAVLLAALVCVCVHGALGSPVHRRALDMDSKVQSSQPSITNNTQETPVEQHNNTATVDRISNILRDLPTIKNVLIFVCGFSTFLIVCLLIKIFRSGKRIRKTRKYDIITTPAERVEMAPLNEENYEEEDSTVFDVKYRYR